MAVTPGRTGYQLPDGTWVAPTQDFGYGSNPYDPDAQPELYQQWQFAHQGDAQQIGQDYSPGRVGAIIGGTVAGGALGDFLAGGGSAAAGAAGGGASAPSAVAGPSAVSGGAAAAFDPTMAVASAPGTITAGGAGAAADTVLGGAGTAAGAGSSFLSQLGRYIGPAVALGQTLISTNAINNARTQQLAAIAKAQAQLTNIYGSTAGTLGNIYNAQVAGMSPYTSLGAGAASLLGKGLGVPVTMPPTGAGVFHASTSPLPPGVAGPQLGGNLTPAQAQQSAQGFPIGLPPGRTLGDVAVNGQVPLGTQQRLAGVIAPPSVLSGSSSYGGGVASGGSAPVRMRAPDGTIEMVAPAMVPHYQSLGAVTV